MRIVETSILKYFISLSLRMKMILRFIIDYFYIDLYIRHDNVRYVDVFGFEYVCVDRFGKLKKCKALNENPEDVAITVDDRLKM